ncbi:hypothetical protein QTP88_009074 [Uroleucon formosanum]
MTAVDYVEDDLDHDFIPITVNEVEEVVNVFDDSNFVPITEDQVEQVEEDLDGSNFDPDLTPITEHQDNQLIEAVKKKKKFSLADKKAVLEAKSELKNVNSKTKHVYFGMKPLLDTLYGFKMNSVVIDKFSRGSTCMEYWTDFNGEAKTLDFLQKKILKDIKTYYSPKKITQHRGINFNKKKEIDKLVPVMPENRKYFWINLPASVTSEDLVDEMGLGNAFITSDYE